MPERFELLSQLGKGGMGTVWKARDTSTGEIIALKLLHEQYADDPYFVERFEREVEVTRKVDSPYVVKMLGYGKREGRPYLAMEYVEGRSLKDIIHDDGPLTWAPARDLLRQVALGLDAAEKAGVVHRDIKPSNILVSGDGAAKLVDFGIAKAADMTALTGMNTTIGTPGYMAPEGKASGQADLYGLGCVAYEMLSGAPPFIGDSQGEVLLKHLREAPDLSKLPEGARRVVGWLLQKDPKRRPASAAALVAVLDGTGSAPKAAARGWRWRPVALIAAPSMLGVAGIVAAVLAFGGRGGGGVPDVPNVAAEAAETPAAGATPAVVIAPSATPAVTSTPVAPIPTDVLPTATPPPSTQTPVPPTPTSTPEPLRGTLTFEPPTCTDCVVPSEFMICWDGAPLGAQFTIAITKVEPTSSAPAPFDDVANGKTHCFISQTTETDVPLVAFQMEARDITGAIIFSQVRRYNTHFSPPPGSPPEITFLTGPATAHLDEPVVFGVFWKDADGDAVQVSLSVEAAVYFGTDKPYLVQRDVSDIAPADQKAGQETLFGVICAEVDPEPRTMTLTVTDKSGFSATRKATFACLKSAGP